MLRQIACSRPAMPLPPARNWVIRRPTWVRPGAFLHHGLFFVLCCSVSDCRPSPQKTGAGGRRAGVVFRGHRERPLRQRPGAGDSAEVVNTKMGLKSGGHSADGERLGERQCALRRVRPCGTPSATVEVVLTAFCSNGRRSDSPARRQRRKQGSRAAEDVADGRPLRAKVSLL